MDFMTGLELGIAMVAAGLALLIAYWFWQEKGLKFVGAGVAILALFFTGYQIREANKSLIFTTEQSLYKESREILKLIAEYP
jgi:uncharacterized membrane protein YqjE